MPHPQTLYTRAGDVHIAYQVVGSGPFDIVFVPGLLGHVDLWWDDPGAARFFRRLASFARLIVFDKRGIGASDRSSDWAPLEERMDDLRAVLDEIGSREVALVGYSEGGALCLLYATACPERTRGVVLASAFARWTATPDYPAGWTGQDIQRLRDYIATRWGAGQTLLMTVASRAGDPAIQAWAARAEQEGASPGAALQLLDMNAQVDVRALLPAVTVPVVALHHTRDAVIRADSSRFLASRIPGARLVEVDGTDHLFVFEGGDDLLAAIEALLAMPRRHEDSFLTTIVALHGGTATGAAELAAAHRGEPAGEGLFGFDGPQRAIRFADVLVRRDPALAAGVHTGEVARAPGGLAGAAVELARRVAGAARPGEVLVTRVVRDLVHGAGLGLAGRGEVALADGALEVLSLVRER
jgi:pimeloyl-ACP methyl ester carboxylesterase